MYRIANKIVIGMVGIFVLISCHGLEELNENPNQIGSENVDPNLLLPTVVNGVGKNVVNLGFGSMAGVMQHTQKDGWSSGHNAYDWSNDSHSWNGYYSLLTNNKTMIQKAEEESLDFHHGVGLILKSYLFGMIADLWGDAPYSNALRGDEGSEFFDAEFDTQQSIYEGIHTDLKKANLLLSNSQDSYFSIQANQDILFAGDVAKWRKFGNSLLLRYYMRLSEKEPGIARQGIQAIASQPQTYPLILQAEDDANMPYIGNTTSDSWPTNTKFDADPQGAYFRIKLAKTFVDKLQELNDPRLGVWANKIDVPLVLEEGAPEGTDFVDEEGKRHISQDIVDAYENTAGLAVDFDSLYVGLPTALTFGASYNLSEDVNQGTRNLHVSQLNDIYKEASGPLLQARLISASEVNFILAEAAAKGWISGSAENYYNEAIKQSFAAWGVSDDYDDYIANGGAYSAAEDIIVQKWIASWSAATEAWFDYRRTGLPELETGPASKRAALPLRFYYHIDEIDNNQNSAEAIDRLEPTQFKGDDASNNSAWSKFWLLQGTSQPY